MYGVMLLLGIAACIWLTGRRWVSWGGDWDLVFRMALWGVIAGVVGARLYHDITSWNQDPAIHAHWYGFAAVWDGGLGIWGAIPFGVLAGAIVVKRSGNSVTLMMDAVAPGLLLAQGIGRWGNYWNQELYGRPTTLPWGAEDRSGAPERDPGALPGRRRLPADVPLRVRLGPDRSRRPALDRPALHDQAARRSSRSTSPGTRPSARSRSSCGSTPPTTSSTSGSTSGSRSESGSSRSASSSGGSSSTTPSEKPEKPRAEGPADAERAAHGRPQGPRPVTPLGSGA